jgi:hypothetical protein
MPQLIFFQMVIGHITTEVRHSSLKTRLFFLTFVRKMKSGTTTLIGSMEKCDTEYCDLSMIRVATCKRCHGYFDKCIKHGIEVCPGCAKIVNEKLSTRETP